MFYTNLYLYNDTYTHLYTRTILLQVPILFTFLRKLVGAAAAARDPFPRNDVMALHPARSAEASARVVIDLKQPADRQTVPSNSIRFVVVRTSQGAASAQAPSPTCLAVIVLLQFIVLFHRRLCARVLYTYISYNSIVKNTIRRYNIIYVLLYMYVKRSSNTSYIVRPVRENDRHRNNAFRQRRVQVHLQQSQERIEQAQGTYNTHSPATP